MNQETPTARSGNPPGFSRGEDVNIAVALHGAGPATPPAVDPAPSLAPLCLTYRPLTVCLCGGDLGALCGDLVHIDTCPECRDHPGVCPRRADHTVCAVPEPVTCEHAGCRQPHSIDSADCAYGHEYCCGCCHPDLLED